MLDLRQRRTDQRVVLGEVDEHFIERAVDDLEVEDSRETVMETKDIEATPKNVRTFRLFINSNDFYMFFFPVGRLTN
jgi:hypothetical protein